MKPASPRGSQAAAVALVAATYFYFLIFAEFAFLERIRVAVADLRTVMAALGAGGIVGAIGMAVFFRPSRATALLAWTLRACAAGASLALVVGGVWLGSVAAFLCGAALGALTVGVASVLRDAAGSQRLGLTLGLGTGIAYALCNVPVLFRASPAMQTILAAAAVMAVSFGVRFLNGGTEREATACPEPKEAPVRWTLVLLALVWLDSAAFYIIQHSPALRLETWEQTRTLWMNAAIHLAGAIAAGLWLDRGRRAWVMALAVTSLAFGGLILGGHLPAWFAPSMFYTAGVSFYSVALVEIPARSGRPWAAALIFSVAGWIGSALGIGMAQDLAHIPVAFIAAAVGVVALGLLGRRPAAWLAALLVSVGAGRADEVRRGREVYIAEGCIHCHSQYVRAQVPTEVLNWGPATSLDETLVGQPPLFGTRRQGPDLARVGNRRSAEWNRLHLIAPQTVSPGSRMPAYAHLFAAGDRRGDALLDYLASLGAETRAERQRQIDTWKPVAREAIPPAASAALFQRLCAACHGPEGRGDGPLAEKLSIRPPNWSREAWRHLRRGEDRDTALARLIKFGLPSLPMAGHEYLSDPELVGLARYVRTLHKTDDGATPVTVQP